MTREVKREEMENILGHNTNFTAEKSNPASPAQLKYISDLATQRNLPVPTVNTFDEADMEIKRLSAIPRNTQARLISDKQKERIVSNCELLKMPLPPNLDSMDGSYGGEASKFIEITNKRIEALGDKILASEKQVALILNMQYCPACKVVENPHEMSRVAAGDYIAKNKSEFYNWQRTRLTKEQATLIETLTERLDSKLDYAQIIQFDIETATQYITQLEQEIANKELYSGFEQELENEIPFDLNPENKSAAEELKELVAHLYASIGQELEEEIYETLDWGGLKELVDFCKFYVDGSAIAEMVERVTSFTQQQKLTLLAD